VASDGVSPVYIDPFPEERGPTIRQRVGAWWSGIYGRHQGKTLVLASALVTLAVIGLYDTLHPRPQDLSQGVLNAAVNYAIDHRPEQPAASAIAYAKIIPAVVRVDGYDPIERNSSGSPDDRTRQPGKTPPMKLATNAALPGYENTAAGTGVVIADDGTIMTALHVASATKKLRVIFADGTEANAAIAGADPSNDMAILKPDKIPDDLQPATLASTQGLHPGDQVEAVGFPFGIGPSASSGIVSGLKREFEDEGRAKISNLIQFDAAANPGNSGGPLINSHGEVVGIVDAILNPSARTFAGIGFAVPIENAMKGAMGESPL
jgi:S1-C subfamily serine protease